MMKYSGLLILTVLLAFSGSLSAATVVHWTFDDANLGAANGTAMPDSDEQTVWREAATDQSGNGNHLTTWDYSWAGFAWTADSIQGDLAMVATGSYPASMTWSDESEPSGIDAETIAPAQWTVEVIFKCDDPTTYRTLIGRDGMETASDNDALAPFYLSERADGVIGVQFVDNSGTSHSAFSDTGTIVDGTWYHVAGVSDGQTLSIYLKDLDADTDYRIVASADLSDSSDSSLATGNSSGDGWAAGTWTVARGLYNGSHTDRFFGAIDEVAISTDALTEASFVCQFASGSDDPNADDPDDTDAPNDNVTYTRDMEYLDRGLVAVRRSDGDIFLSWRMLGTDPNTVSFNLYDASTTDRGGNPTLINDSPITDSTNYLDTDGSSDSTYCVAAIIDGNEQDLSDPVEVWSSYCHDIPLQKPDSGTTPDNATYDYSANDASVADLDGDGQYELILKWNPSNAQDNSKDGYTGNVLLDAYEFDGTLLWRIDLGVNIRAGAHYTQFIAYDLDSDGRAELVCKTADGTTDGQGTVLGDADADYRSSVGRILSGPEYLSVFDGLTGAFIDTVDYIPARGTVSDWGDSYGNRVDRFLAGAAYLDGQHPSVVMCRGYYTRTVLAAWDYEDEQLVSRWVFDNDDSGNSAYAGQGCHSLSVADVDDDGLDEIIYGSCTIDDDGTGLYSTELGHGDALHVSDMIPERHGLEVFECHEHAPYGHTLRDAADGEILWRQTADSDTGRCAAAHIDADYPGYQMWSSASSGTYNASDRSKISDNQPYWGNFLVWWDDDLQREILDVVGSDANPILAKWNGDGVDRLISLYSVPTSYSTGSINGSKGNPCLSGDILGDWREEMIYPSSDDTELHLFINTELTDHRIYTLMHDSQYREAIAWQNVGYNQPPHPSFYIGADMNEPPTPDIVLVGASE